MPFSDRSFKRIQKFTVLSIPRTVITEACVKMELESLIDYDTDITAMKLPWAMTYRKVNFILFSD